MAETTDWIEKLRTSRHGPDFCDPGWGLGDPPTQDRQGPTRQFAPWESPLRLNGPIFRR